MKYIIITGSVMSGIGKGTVASSFGVVLQAHGFKVTAIKIDPYLNPDCGTMSPFEHGEVYVLNDGGETDLDLGNYERFLQISLTKDHNITTGKVYSKVIQEERQGKYLGKTVQIVPHITNAIQGWIENTATIPVDDSKEIPEVCLIELGGTLGDLESGPYAEALRQMRFKLGEKNVMIVNVCYVPVLSTTQETKTKPAQAGIREARSLGLPPDILVVRCSRELTQDSLNKLSDMCQIPPNKILMNQDLSSIYQIPSHFHEKNLFSLIDNQLDFNILGILHLPGATGREINMLQMKDFWDNWNQMTDQFSQGITKKVAIVGKYTDLTDSYLSLTHAIKHGAAHAGIKPELIWIESEKLADKFEEEEHNKLTNADAILIPGGFGQRGIEGMIIAAQFARQNHIPCLGVCLGFQVMVMEYARTILNLKGANSTEFDPNTPHPVITIMEEDQKIMGGTMRLGLKKTIIKHGSIAAECYGQDFCLERHRHRYEVNPKYLDSPLQNIFSGTDESGKRMEILELPRTNHHFYVGTQFHGEYLTRPQHGHPIFIGWMKACLK